MCQQSMLQVMLSEKEVDATSSDEAGEHKAWNLFLDVVAQDSPGMLMESFFVDEELARTTLSCHLSLDLFCQEMLVAW